MRRRWRSSRSRARAAGSWRPRRRSARSRPRLTARTNPNNENMQGESQWTALYFCIVRDEADRHCASWSACERAGFSGGDISVLVPRPRRKPRLRSRAAHQDARRRGCRQRDRRRPRRPRRLARRHRRARDPGPRAVRRGRARSWRRSRGAAAGAAVGGLTGALIGMGIPEYEAKQYEGKLRDGNLLISVHTEDGEQRQLRQGDLRAGRRRGRPHRR